MQAKLFKLSLMTESTSRIIKTLRAVPKGKVSCYRDIALAAGLPNGARQVVRALHSMSEKHALPWHRIIRADGFIALESCQGREEQCALLRAEGVEVSKTGRVDLAKYGCGLDRLSRAARRGTGGGADRKDYTQEFRTIDKIKKNS